eukprot:2455493-Rhodomonas_salina.1
MLFKSKGVARGTAAHMAQCRITPKILVAAQKSGAESRTYIKPIVIQGVAGEQTIDKAGNLHLPAVS